ncbi:hypothetical protein QTG56_25540 (plasmid) [Rossellomorea sp. AcN35-11]|nr:hypothetical protein [Rossellomorea aquimaris]WJV31979.1 hypothetical protein QTG56_25540 [Rossellomorea sp. AcN35-11]
MKRKRVELEIVVIDGVDIAAKICTKCDTLTTLDHFNNDKKGKFGKSSQCKECKKKQDKKYIQDNKEKIAANKREYRKKNAERFRERERKYRTENKESIAKYMKQYAKDNADDLRRKRKEHYEQNKERYKHYNRAYYKENRDVIKGNSKRHYEENKPVILKRQKEYNKANAEVIAERKKEYSTRNAEWFKEYKKRWSEENKDSIRERRKEYRLKNAKIIKERKRLYSKENRHIKSASNQRRRAIEKLLPHTFSAQDSTELMDHFYHQCAISSNSNDDIHLDHFIALATGHGGTIKGNMLPIAGSLNISKNYYNPFEWIQRKDIAKQLNVKKWRKALHYLAELNGMTVKEFRNYVYECYANPIALQE